MSGNADVLHLLIAKGVKPNVVDLVSFNSYISVIVSILSFRIIKPLCILLVVLMLLNYLLLNATLT